MHQPLNFLIFTKCNEIIFLVSDCSRVLLSAIYDEAISINTKTHTGSPLWSWGGCSGCFQKWRASILHLQPAAAEGGSFLHRYTPASGSTSCPEHTSHIQTWGLPSGTYHSCPATLCTCRGGLRDGKSGRERQIWCDCSCAHTNFP